VLYYKPFISKVLRYGLCVIMGSHSFTCYPHTNHTCLYSICCLQLNQSSESDFSAILCCYQQMFMLLTMPVDRAHVGPWKSLIFSRFSRPWKSLKTDMVPESSWIFVWKSLKVLEFDFLKQCAWTSDFQCNHPITILKFLWHLCPISCPSTFNLLPAHLIC